MMTENDRQFDTAVRVRLFSDSYAQDVVSSVLHRDAAIRQLDRHSRLPGVRFQLQIAQYEDPETGGPLDVDGTTSRTYEEAVGGELYTDGRTLTMTGFQEIGKMDSGTFRLVGLSLEHRH